MNSRTRRGTGVTATALLLCFLGSDCRAQAAAGEAAPMQVSPQESGTAFTAEVQRALDAHDYGTAEKLLLDEIARAPQTPRAARLLEWIGSIYFQNHDALSASIAWKKADAIRPLNTPLKFSLAMAYVAMHRPDWARGELENLAAADAKNALYVYWLGRLDYDGHFYPSAKQRFLQATELDPTMARAWDNLGLVYYYLNLNGQAVESFHKAIELERATAHPSAWPYLNLGITEQFLNRLTDAEAHLREAIRLDATMAQAHFQLGTVLEDGGKLEEAAREFKEAARLDPAYQEPHMALARLYHKLGQESAAREEVLIYRRLHTSPPKQN